MRNLVSIGWREWLSLPGLGIPRIKAKVDTGARSSCLHAFNVTETRRGGVTSIWFDVHPLQRDDQLVVRCKAPLIAYRTIKSSNGTREHRPVVRTLVQLDGERWPMELTLTARDEMGFRMLLGREAIRGRYVVDPGRSFLMRGSVPKKSKIGLKKKTKSESTRRSRAQKEKQR